MDTNAVENSPSIESLDGEPSEEVLGEVLVISRSPLAYGHFFFLFTLLSLFGFYSILALPWSVWPLHIGFFTLFVPLLAIPAIVVGMYLVHELFDARYIIGPQSIQCIEGIISLNKRDDILEYRHVSSIEVDYGIYGRIFDTGRVSISAIGDENNLVMSHVAQPAEIRKTILECKEAATKSVPYLLAD